MSLKSEDIRFDYYTDDSERFARDFMNHVATNIPLFALQDELIYLMQHQKKTSFKIPGYKSIDGKDHVFYFELRDISENQQVKVYRYLGMDLKTK